jgi:DNA mismatch repair protein MutS
MLRQYTQAKAVHPDAIVLFRLGNFYEMFNKDAQQGARLLELVLTSRESVWKSMARCTRP